jgi:hypothetical protein
MMLLRSALLILLLPAVSPAGGSADYTLDPLALDGGGLSGSGLDWRAVFSAMPGGSGSSTHYTLDTGFAGQLEEDAPAIIRQWRAQWFGTAAERTGDLEDFDSDGIVNLMEFAFGTNPASPLSGPPELIYTGALSGNGTLTRAGQPITRVEPVPTGVDFRAVFVRRKDFAAARLAYTPQFSATLNLWQNSPAVPVVLADDGTWQVVSVPYTPFIAGRKARFFRIKVDLLP